MFWHMRGRNKWLLACLVLALTCEEIPFLGFLFTGIIQAVVIQVGLFKELARMCDRHDECHRVLVVAPDRIARWGVVRHWQRAPMTGERRRELQRKALELQESFRGMLGLILEVQS